ncbi:MAG: YkgJ family cysteine cluster protein, partial [Desulfurococcaceae archaeon]
MSPISILPHEEVVLKRLAEEMDISITFTHGYTIYEAVSGINLALSYVMQLLNNRCPFLEENKCRLHYVYKPSVCRGFPYTPRQVRYSIDDANKYIVASTDYGLSLACHIVKRDREVLEKYRDNPGIIVHYIKQEYLTSIETENIRGLLLTSLSKLWRDGLVEIKSGRPNAPV